MDCKVIPQGTQTDQQFIISEDNNPIERSLHMELSLATIDLSEPSFL